MRALENQYEWEIDYRINKTENDIINEDRGDDDGEIYNYD